MTGAWPWPPGGRFRYVEELLTSITDRAVADAKTRAVMRVCLLGCAKSKLSTAAPARALYTSQLFRLALAWAEAQGFDAIYVVSALHGLVPLDRVLAPYDVTIKDLRPRRRARWGKNVARDVLRAHVAGRAFEVTLLLGDAYARHIRADLVTGGAVLREPLAGLAIGLRKRWLARER